MNKILYFLLILLLLFNFSTVVHSQEESVKKKKQQIKGAKSQVKQRAVGGQKEYVKVKTKDPVSKNVSWSTETEEEELIPVIVKNEFDEEIKVKFDTNREYPIAPHEGITLGKRKPGRYTLTIYTKHGEFVDNVTRTIDKKNKFVLNKNTVVNAGKITGLTTGQKVAITAGAIGATALGGALVNKALEGDQTQGEEAYIPPSNILEVPSQVAQVVAPVGVAEEAIDENNAYLTGGNPFKFLNTKYDQVTLIVEGTDGNPIGSNWIIPKATSLQKAQPLVFNGQKITIGPDQIIKVVLSDGKELQRYAFELDKDLVDGSYIWVMKWQPYSI